MKGLLKWILGRRPSPALVVAMAALVAALSGTAAALQGHNTVKSNDIAPRAVKSSDIGVGAVGAKQLRGRAVTPAKSGLVTSGSVAAANATTASSPTDLGGPSVSVTVPPGALIEIYVLADMSVTGTNTARVDLFEPSLLPGSPQILASQSNSFDRRYTAPGTADQDGVTAPTRSGWIVVPPLPGTYTFSLRYETSGGTATFQNRVLFARVIR